MFHFITQLYAKHLMVRDLGSHSVNNYPQNDTIYVFYLMGLNWFLWRNNLNLILEPKILRILTAVCGSHNLQSEFYDTKMM